MSISIQKLGLGTAPLGNMFREVPEEEALETIQTAWDQGIRYFDTAPFYGAGLAEIRLGKVLSQYNRSDFLIGTKVGRVIEDELEEKSGMFEFGRKNKITTDYSEDTTLRSIEQSLERLNTDSLDFVYVHDVSPDFLGDEWKSQFDIAKKGAFRVLTRLREEGVIQSWGLGVNRTEPIELAIELEDLKPDLCLQANRYTLLDHEQALQKMMPESLRQQVKIVVGAPYGSGVLAGGDHYEYGEIPDDIAKKKERIQALANQHGVSMTAAALQFSFAHPAVEFVIPGTTRAEHVRKNIAAFREEIPAAFWSNLRDQKLVAANAPLPID
ncbi:aldo/keto reductase [Bacillus lacus]|uniref:Aldo/keto reductase n=1 Tax=Metabacillus lacus TaxID=1983721 RepID=A0A7X2J0N6_9BACI|nr:aldo/keto reductase [Metabacillus lacus]MRX73195.1 aldo/keto reductase [Metabacillus lacus]